jgi:hypothetical protein
MSNDTVIISPPETDTVVLSPQNISTIVINQGARGPVGAAGSGVTIPEVSETFTQAIPSASWTIHHSLAFSPVVTVVDSSGRVVEGDVTYVDSSTITVSFSSAFSGTAYLS